MSRNNSTYRKLSRLELTQFVHSLEREIKDLRDDIECLRRDLDERHSEDIRDNAESLNDVYRQMEKLKK